MSAGPGTPQSEGAGGTFNNSSSSPPMTPKGGPRSFKKHKPSKLPLAPVVPGKKPPGVHNSTTGVVITDGRLEVGDFEVSREGAVSKKVWLLVNDPQFSASFSSACGHPPAASPIIFSDAPFDQRRKALEGRMAYEDLLDEGFLGKGHTSSVRKVTYRPTERQFALKEIKITDPNDTTKFSGVTVGLDQAQLETVLLRELQMLHANHVNEHIVKYYDAYYRDGFLRITLEYMHYGSVANILQKVGKWTERPLVSLAEQVATGLNFMHGINKIHRDIKPSNLLINKKGVAKISDFGIAMIGDVDGEVADPGGSLHYMSPERHDHDKKHGASADIWALGVTLAECALGEYPYQIGAVKGPWDLVKAISVELCFPPDLPIDPAFLDLVRACALPDPATARPSAANLLSHPFIEAYRSEANPHSDIVRFLHESVDVKA